MKGKRIFNTDRKKEVSGCWGKEVDPLQMGENSSHKKTLPINT